MAISQPQTGSLDGLSRFLKTYPSMYPHPFVRASTYLSVRPSIHPSVRPSFRPSFHPSLLLVCRLLCGPLPGAVNTGGAGLVSDWGTCDGVGATEGTVSSRASWSAPGRGCPVRPGVVWVSWGVRVGNRWERRWALLPRVPNADHREWGRSFAKRVRSLTTGLALSKRRPAAPGGLCELAWSPEAT